MRGHESRSSVRRALGWRVALALGLALGCGSPASVQPSAVPATATAAPVITELALRYRPDDDAWERAPTERTIGLYWVLPLENGMLDSNSPGRFEQVGPGCGPFDLGPPQPGRVALCVPQSGHAEPRFVAAPPVDEGLLPLCGDPPRGVCRGVRASVRSEVTPALSEADLAAIRTAWVRFLIAFGESDDRALTLACTRVGTPDAPLPGSLVLFGTGAERAHAAVRFDETGLVLYSADERGVLGGLEGELQVGALGLRFVRGTDGTWALCELDTEG